jgi:hypothetical protein
MRAATRLKFAARLGRRRQIGQSWALSSSTGADFLPDPNLSFRLARRFGALTLTGARST